MSTAAKKIAKTTITDPGLNRILDRMVPLYFRNSGRKGDRKTVLEALARDRIAQLQAAGWFEDPDRAEGLVDAQQTKDAEPLRIVGGL